VTDLAVGKKVPKFSAVSTHGGISSETLLGRPYVLYFYPKDNTPGCSLEAQEFATAHERFRRRGAAVLGVSRDGLAAHAKFSGKFSLPFPLIADENEALCGLFDVIKIKNMYGKQVRGIERSTFLVDDRGVLRREWRKIKVNGHVDDVLGAVEALSER
jgi:peroxiredoxin Q/BCP